MDIFQKRAYLLPSKVWCKSVSYSNTWNDIIDLSAQKILGNNRQAESKFASVIRLDLGLWSGQIDTEDVWSPTNLLT